MYVNLLVGIIVNLLLLLIYMYIVVCASTMSQIIRVVECGDYVMWFMCDIILSRSTYIVGIVSTPILKISSCHLF